MDRFIADLIESTTLKLNPLIVRGYAYHQVPYVEQYLDNILREASKSFPPGLRYVGPIERVSPYEEYQSILARSGRVEYDLSKNTVFTVKINFEYEGKPLTPKYLALPYVEEGGMFRVAGATYRITPVLTDRVLSIENDKVFIRLLRNKIFVRRALHTVKIDGHNEMEQVLWVKLYYGKDMSPTTKVTTISHYLLGKYGFTEMCSKYLGYIPIFGTQEELTYDKYPLSEWVHIESSGTIPKPLRNQKHYIHNIYKMVYPRDKWNQLSRNMLVGMLYVMDIFPEHIEKGMLDDIRAWRLIMAKILFSETMTNDKLLSKMSRHYGTIDHYIDVSIKNRLQEARYEINDFFELLVLIMENFMKWILESADISSMVYNRYLDVIYYIMYDIIASVFMIGSNLDKDNNNGKRITEKDVEQVLRGKLSKGKIYGLTNSREPNLALSLIEYCGDNLYPEITSPMELQENGEGVKRKKQKRMKIGARHYLRGPDLYIGSLLFLPKSTPTPKARINPYANISPSTGNILPDDHSRELLDKLDDMLHTNRTDTGSQDVSNEDIADVEMVDD